LYAKEMYMSAIRKLIERNQFNIDPGDKRREEADAAAAELEERDRADAELLEALKAVQVALGDEYGRASYWPARKYLASIDVYEGDLEGDAVLHAVLRVALPRWAAAKGKTG
jgi:hypothetical protein